MYQEHEGEANTSLSISQSPPLSDRSSKSRDYVIVYMKDPPPLPSNRT